MSIQEQAIALLEAQQAKVKPRSPQWMVGEQLKDICRMEPRSAELIAQDLENEATPSPPQIISCAFTASTAPHSRAFSAARQNPKRLRI